MNSTWCLKYPVKFLQKYKYVWELVGAGIVQIKKDDIGKDETICIKEECLLQNMQFIYNHDV